MEITGQAAERPALSTYEDVAGRLELPLLAPALSEEQVEQACRAACSLRLAAVSVRPSDVDLAARWLDGSGVRLATVVGFPWGASTTPAKAYETRDLLRRGAKEIGVVVNIGRLVSRQFQYIEMELQQLAEACHKESALLKVIFENEFLTDDLKTVLCKISKRVEADFVDTSTGFGAKGAVLEDLRLMRARCRGVVKLKATGGIDTFEKFEQLYAEGVERAGAIRAQQILSEWKQRLTAIEQARKSDGDAASASVSSSPSNS
jgi:deoxyribose-phosphate aldolase